jgi:RNA polymerase sigma-70 factor (sigma-E family)
VSGETTAADAADAPPRGVDPLDRRAALSDLYRAEYRNLVRLATLLGGAQDAAEEIVQDAFVKLDQSWDRVADPAARPAYLRTIVLNLARSGHRRKQVADRHRPLPSPDVAPAEHHAVIAEDQREVVEAIRALPERQKQCMVLRFYEDMTEVQIAEALGISQGSVKTHLHRAMQTLSARLGGLA